MTVHRQFGIPDHVVELLGPPPVMHRDAGQFYRLLSELRRATRPCCFLDEMNLWDAACARMSITQVRRTRSAIVALNSERAANEVLRPSSYRFSPPPQLALTGDMASVPGGAEQSARDANREVAIERLSELGLGEMALADISYGLSQEQLGPLDAVQEYNRKVETASLTAVEHRASRRAEATKWLDDERIEDALIAETIEPEPRKDLAGETNREEPASTQDYDGMF